MLYILAHKMFTWSFPPFFILSTHSLLPVQTVEVYAKQTQTEQSGGGADNKDESEEEDAESFNPPPSRKVRPLTQVWLFWC